MSGNLILILGDQLNRSSAVFDGFDPSCDQVWMAEVVEESTHVWSHKARIVLFLSAMRHFRDQLRAEGMRVVYRSLPAEPLADEPASLAAALLSDLTLARRGAVPAKKARASVAGKVDPIDVPERLIVVEPGEWRVRQALVAMAREAGIELEIRDDRHFFSSPAEFAAHAAGRKQLRLEYFYRPLRERFGVLIGPS